MFEIIYFSLAAVLMVLTLAPLSRSQVWWIRGLDFPRLQLSVLLAALLVVGLVVIRDWTSVTAIALGLLIGCLVCQLWWVVPYTFFFPKEVEAVRAGSHYERLRIMTANVLTPNHNSDGLIKLVHDFTPDVLVTLESDDWWQERLDVIEKDYPCTVKVPLDNLYGMHVYSRYVLSDVNVEYLVEDDKPSIHCFIELPCGQRVKAHFVHPAPPSPSENEESEERDAELVLVARRVEPEKYPTIVTGDLNDVAWSRTTLLFRKISSLLDPRIGRGMFNTFHAEYWFARWPLDHIFHSHHFALVSMTRLPGFGSDHFPLLTELALAPGENGVDDGPSPDEEDKEAADEIVNKAMA
ncbi:MULTISPECIES: endonuclease/exonuclease/phosphatase family protein [Idiomarina]|jgi:endonuclease/exonuclease/phosphatase (EEP) superfamily protein YafD|uniref:Endonuclease/exonuclease/phosphatase family protein n=1 Tax=Idiomarina abyssalis TaxID=86102 RepID=A0A8I1GBN8_9GAMM|nr:MULTISPECIES: endonuclease/exonuclease/phosphatase family protein [Idiomarina]KPD22917.1 endonuclease [Idiomarina abyssalis]MBF80677.1 endonuclease/exonuclease/phosphatase family protein [Idiomarina sp.]MBJ7267105.1 endonuclease/exonuclease/phosphatase family protein [Idiomarina abyssalis]MBJ7274557.1 endonuclease/exonuclease/phosphatase family protein [Idiomarina abyssalis]MBJ7315476.1 endonuclease/exonuclease/phosphatase family protein [Idiomarina abyssalis]|tara:strand:- start:12012 stop:13067 length:1056 start_codon:yes stop_codon:yes gene_type:complete